MSTAQKSIPTLRFPEFSGDWKEKRIENLFSEFKSGHGITASQIFGSGKYPVFGGNGLRGFTEKYTHNGFYLLIGRQGALCGNINRSKGKAFISEHAIACKANETSDTEWLAQRLEYFDLNRLSESSAQPGLSVNKILRYKLIVPLIYEQQKIASFLTAIDSKIEQLTKKKSLLEQYKKGVMQQVFSQQLRFKPVLSEAEGDENGNEFPDWEEKKLGEICDIKKGIQLNAEYLTKVGSYPCINGGISASGYTESYNKLENTITISEGGNSCGFINFIFTKFWSGGHCYTLENIIDTIESEFLYQLLKYNEIKIMRLRVGSGLPNIQKKDIVKFNIQLPSSKEQSQIANFLSAIDTKIDLVNTQLENTQQYKKGLLQQMFV